MTQTKPWETFFSESLDELQSQRLLRQRVAVVDGPDAHTQWRKGQLVINFGTNDYLGIRHDLTMQRAVTRGCAVTGVGAGASPLVSGYSSLLHELESALADWQGTEAAMVFSSGFAMNVGVIACLVDNHDLVLSDQLNHASLIDGCRLSGAHKRVYAHADVSAAERILQSERAKYRRAILVTESVYSMDGDIAPLRELAELCARYDTGLVVDEAHATGVYGPTGAGWCELLKDSVPWLAKLGTLSKGIGTCGGFVAGSRAMIDYLVNRCRSYIYSTAISPNVVAATLASIEMIPTLDHRRNRLFASSRLIRESLSQRGWKVTQDDSPIVPVIVGSAEASIALSDRLLQAGCYVPAIRPPTVPRDSARLRISLSATHSDDQLAHLLQALGANR